MYITTNIFRSTTRICSRSSTFLVYINDMPKCLKPSVSILFADYSTVLKQHHNLRQLFEATNLDLKLLLEWFMASILKVNPV